MTLKKIQIPLFFLLTPLYLALVYYKTVFSVDLNGLVFLSSVIFVLYFPFKKVALTPLNLVSIGIVFIFFLYIMAQLLTTFHSYTLSLVLIFSMIFLSFFGTYFQLKVFLQIFTKKFNTIGLLVLFVFYAAMLIGISNKNTLNKTFTKIYEGQIIEQRVHNSLSTRFLSIK